jgi:hypothetical protein
MDDSVDRMWVSLARVGHATRGHDIALATSTDLPQPLAQLFVGAGVTTALRPSGVPAVYDANTPDFHCRTLCSSSTTCELGQRRTLRDLFSSHQIPVRVFVQL